MKKYILSALLLAFTFSLFAGEPGLPPSTLLGKSVMPVAITGTSSGSLFMPKNPGSVNIISPVALSPGAQVQTIDDNNAINGINGNPYFSLIQGDVYDTIGTFLYSGTASLYPNQGNNGEQFLKTITVDPVGAYSGGQFNPYYSYTYGNVFDPTSASFLDKGIPSLIADGTFNMTYSRSVKTNGYTRAPYPDYLSPNGTNFSMEVMGGLDADHAYGIYPPSVFQNVLNTDAFFLKIIPVDETGNTIIASKVDVYYPNGIFDNTTNNKEVWLDTTKSAKLTGSIPWDVVANAPFPQTLLSMSNTAVDYPATTIMSTDMSGNYIGNPSVVKLLPGPHQYAMAIMPVDINGNTSASITILNDHNLPISETNPLSVDTLDSYITATWDATTNTAGGYSLDLLTPTAGKALSIKAISWATSSTSSNGTLKISLNTSNITVEHGFITSNTKSNNRSLHIDGAINEKLSLTITSGGSAQPYFITVTYNQE